MSMTRLNSLRWKGYFYDVETGLYFINGRWYDPETCRYISPTDHTAISLLSPNGANRYAFESGNSVDNAYTNTIAGGNYSDYRNFSRNTNLTAVPWVVSNATTIYGAISSLAIGTPIAYHYFKYASYINDEFR